MQSTATAAVSASLLALVLAPGLAAQSGTASSGFELDASARSVVIDGVLSRLNTGYVFPEVAKEMERAIRARAERGEYDRIMSAAGLADSLTLHLRAISHDKHLRVRFSAEPIAEPRPGTARAAEALAQLSARMRFVNFGIEKVERLEGNIGYLELRTFVPAEVEGAASALAAAMNVLTRTDALIIDLRRNSGGNPSMVRLLSSYFLGAEPVHLNSLYGRDSGRTEEFWSLAELEAKRYGPERPIYILTSKRTFSAAEEFAYNLQSLKRAAVAGETTAGGAHAGSWERVSGHFSVWIPRVRAVNPITGTNWEGTGVEPDLKVAAEEALTAAHGAILQELLAAATDPGKRMWIQEALSDLRK